MNWLRLLPLCGILLASGPLLYAAEQHDDDDRGANDAKVKQDNALSWTAAHTGTAVGPCLITRGQTRLHCLDLRRK